MAAGIAIGAPHLILPAAVLLCVRTCSSPRHASKPSRIGATRSSEKMAALSQAHNQVPAGGFPVPTSNRRLVRIQFADAIPTETCSRAVYAFTTLGALTWKRAQTFLVSTTQFCTFNDGFQSMAS